MQGLGRLPVPFLLVLFSALSTAWAWPGSFEKADGLLLRRDDSSNTDTSFPTLTTETAAASLSITSEPASREESSAKTTTAGSESAAATTEVPFSEKQQSTSKHATKSTSIDPRLPPGGVEMLTPAPTAGATYVKVGDYVTFVWNYTSLSVTPTAVDVLASCATNNQMYTIALNQSVTGPTGAVTWDTGEYQSTATIPFVVASYTLVIHDASKEYSAVASAGYLDTYDQYVFGMYTPQPAVKLDDFKCATCSGAVSQHEKQAVSVLLITSMITLFSFTWFAGGFGVFS